MSRSFEPDIGRFHFVGIGGIGMSGIAELMHRLDYQVQGSDQSDGANVQRLLGLGIPVTVGHEATNLDGVDFLVRSTAVQESNAEIVTARARQIPIVHRAEMLGEIMRMKNAIAVAGTHGKTTTTSMVAHLLTEGGLDPTVVSGGIINQFGSNARIGNGAWMVVEADESDGSFTRLPLVMPVITNIDAEHLDHYGSFEHVVAAFEAFLVRMPFFGSAVLCLDHPVVRRLADELQDRRVIGYGLESHSGMFLRAIDLAMEDGQQTFRVVTAEGQTFGPFHLPMPGDHNVRNALAAIAVARELGMTQVQIFGALASFGGIKRRFERVGTVRGIRVIDDYAHHPIEISAVFSAVRRAFDGQLLAVFQPHRYSRLADQFAAFQEVLGQADHLLVLPVYPAGEEPLAGIDTAHFVAEMQQDGARNVLEVAADSSVIAQHIATRLGDGDTVLCLGAGSISSLAHQLPAALSREVVREE